MDKELVNFHMQQTTAMLQVVPQHLMSLQASIDQAEWKSVALYLDMLRADYHHIEGNHATVQRLLSKSNSDIDKLLE